jgi:hypothetical protein
MIKQDYKQVPAKLAISWAYNMSILLASGIFFAIAIFGGGI